MGRFDGTIQLRVGAAADRGAIIAAAAHTLESNMSSPLVPSPDDRASGRRKALRSVFVAPALTTLASGSALAASSVTCFARQLQSPTFPGTVTKADNYYRVELAQLKKNSSQVQYYVLGSRILAISGLVVEAGYKTSMTGSPGRWKLFANNQESADPILTSQPSKTNWTYSANSGVFAVLRFNSAGQVIGVGIGSGQTTAVTQSCWTSVLA